MDNSEEEDGADGTPVRQPRKPRRRQLSEEERESRRAYIATKLGEGLAWMEALVSFRSSA